MALPFLGHLLLLAATATSAVTVSSAAASTSLATAGSSVPAGHGCGGGNATGFTFSSFVSAYRGINLTVLGDANINQGALQITPDTLNDAATYLSQKSGRVLYATPFKLWHCEGPHCDATTGGGKKRVASFRAVFTINIFRLEGTEPAEGFAFVIAPSADEPPAGSSGGYLGLTNASTDGDASNQIIAIELDTEKQPYDPDDNHVGLNVNSVISVAETRLKPLGIEISPVEPVNYNVWVDYDGAARQIAVYMAVAGKTKPGRVVLAAPLDLGAIVAEWSYFGFSASTGHKYQLNAVLAWNLTLEMLPCDDGGGDGKRRMLGLAVGVPVGVTALVAAAILLAYMCVVKRWKVKHGDSSAIIGTGTMMRSGRASYHRHQREAYG